MTVNQTLSIPNALKSERPHDYYENTATIDWPLGPSGEPFAILGGSVMPGRGFQGWRPRRGRQGVRPLPRGRGLARPLPQLLRRAHAAADAEAPRSAVLARPERPAPHGRGDAGQLARARTTTTLWPWATGGTTRSGRSSPGGRRSIASPPRASAPSRRSTRRSPASSRSSANRQPGRTRTTRPRLLACFWFRC